MTTKFSVEIEFCKEKLGFRVKELILDQYISVDAASDIGAVKVEDSVTHVETDFVAEDGKPTDQTDEKVVAEQIDERR